MEVCAANPPSPLALSWTVPLPESSRNSPIEPRAPEPVPVPYRTKELERLQPPSWTVSPVVPAPWPLNVTVSPAPPCKTMLSCAGQSAARIANVNAAIITDVGPRARIRSCIKLLGVNRARKAWGSRDPAAAPSRRSECGSGHLRCAAAAKAEASAEHQQSGAHQSQGAGLGGGRNGAGPGGG